MCPDLWSVQDVLLVVYVCMYTALTMWNELPVIISEAVRHISEDMNVFL